MLRHLFQECLGTRSDQELPIQVPAGAVVWVSLGIEIALTGTLGFFYVVDQGLIQVKYKGVFAVLLKARKVWRVYRSLPRELFWRNRGPKIAAVRSIVLIDCG